MSNNDIINSFNIYKIIAVADSPASLLSTLSDKITPLPNKSIAKEMDNIDDQDEDGEEIYLNYLHYFKEYKFLEESNEK